MQSWYPEKGLATLDASLESGKTLVQHERVTSCKQVVTSLTTEEIPAAATAPPGKTKPGMFP
jgi:hypothetical protein